MVEIFIPENSEIFIKWIQGFALEMEILEEYLSSFNDLEMLVHISIPPIHLLGPVHIPPWGPNFHLTIYKLISTSKPPIDPSFANRAPDLKFLVQWGNSVFSCVSFLANGVVSWCKCGNLKFCRVEFSEWEVPWIDC